MNRNLLDMIRGRLHAAEAVLALPRTESEETLNRVLASTADALRISIDRLETALWEHEKALTLATTVQEQHSLLLNVLPVASVTTSHSAEITGANPEAGLLLHASPRTLIGKSLLLYFDDRGAWMDTLRRLEEIGTSVHRPAIVRPKERARRHVLIDIVRLGADTLQWFLLPDSTATEDTTPVR